MRNRYLDYLGFHCVLKFYMSLVSLGCKLECVCRFAWSSKGGRRPEG